MDGGPGPAESPHRLFIALGYSPEERAALAQARDEAVSRLRKATPTAAENLHMTLVFLGMLSAETEVQVAEAMAAAASHAGPVSVTLGDLGAFSRRRGSIIWRGVAKESGLLDLQGDLVRELRLRGWEPGEERPFTPHVTLARGARPYPDEDLESVLAGISSTLAPLAVTHAGLSLMWSHHPEGASLVYTPLVTEALQVP